MIIRIPFILLILGLLVNQVSEAQCFDNLYWGHPRTSVRAYVVPNSGDTTYGVMTSYKYIRARSFLSEVTIDGKTYKAGKCKGLGVLVALNENKTAWVSKQKENKNTFWKHYESVVFGKKRDEVFALRFAEGSVKLWIDPMSSMTNSKWSRLIWQTDANELIKVNKKNYSMYQKEIFGGCDFVLSRIEKDPKLQDFHEIRKVVEMYEYLCE